MKKSKCQGLADIIKKRDLVRDIVAIDDLAVDLLRKSADIPRFAFEVSRDDLVKVIAGLGNICHTYVEDYWNDTQTMADIMPSLWRIFGSIHPTDAPRR